MALFNIFNRKKNEEQNVGPQVQTTHTDDERQANENTVEQAPVKAEQLAEEQTDAREPVEQPVVTNDPQNSQPVAETPTEEPKKKRILPLILQSRKEGNARSGT